MAEMRLSDGVCGDGTGGCRRSHPYCSASPRGRQAGAPRAPDRRGALRAPAARRRWVAKRTASSPAPRAGGSGTWRPARRHGPAERAKHRKGNGAHHKQKATGSFDPGDLTARDPSATDKPGEPHPTRRKKPSAISAVEHREERSQPNPGRPAAQVAQAGQLGDRVRNHVAAGPLVAWTLPSCRSAAVHTFAGSSAMACSTVALTAQPVTQRTRRTRRRLGDSCWR